jgi:hypothetical protein
MTVFVLVAFRKSEYNALKQVNPRYLTHRFCAQQPSGIHLAQFLRWYLSALTR